MNLLLGVEPLQLENFFKTNQGIMSDLFGCFTVEEEDIDVLRNVLLLSERSKLAAKSYSRQTVQGVS